MESDIYPRNLNLGPYGLPDGLVGTGLLQDSDSLRTKMGF